MSEVKYDVYGMGNALVDTEYEIDQEFLERYEVAKGIMTLIDADRQKVLLEGLADRSSRKMQAGGSAGNSTVSISQFGGRAFYSCKVANDKLGQFFMEDLAEKGIATNLDHGALPGGVTGQCLVFVTPDAERTMNTFLGITGSFSRSDLMKSELARSKYLYIEGYLVATDLGQQAMKLARNVAEQNGVKTSITFSDPSMVRFFSDPLREIIGNGVDLLFCNEEEAIIFTQEQNIQKAREKLKESASSFVITQGRNGAIIWDGTTFVDIEPYPVDAIDSNGAGDMFSGAFLYGITNGHSHAEAGKLASLASSKVVTQFGPRLSDDKVSEVLSHLVAG